MPINQIKDTIQKEVQEKIAEIETGAQKEIETIQLNLQSEIDSLNAQIKTKADEKIEKIKKQFLIACDSKKRNAILLAKQEIISEAKENLSQHLNSLKSDDYQKIIERMLNNVSITSEKIEMIVPVSKEQESKKALELSGKKFILTTDKNLKNGFVIKDKFSEINNSFDEVVGQIFEEEEMKIVDLLFN